MCSAHCTMPAPLVVQGRPRARGTARGASPPELACGCGASGSRKALQRAPPGVFGSVGAAQPVMPAAVAQIVHTGLVGQLDVQNFFSSASSVLPLNPPPVLCRADGGGLLCRYACHHWATGNATPITRQCVNFHVLCDQLAGWARELSLPGPDLLSHKVWVE
jgi:hypothetical protein